MTPLKSDVPSIPRSIRLTPEQWAKFYERGGADWIRSMLNCQHPLLIQVATRPHQHCLDCGLTFPSSVFFPVQ